MPWFPSLPVAKLAAPGFFLLKPSQSLGVFVSIKADLIPSLLQEALGKSSRLP